MFSTVTRRVLSGPDRRGGVGARPGFSIPELVVVLVVVSVLAVVAVPTVEVVRFRMDGAARGAAATLVSAQRLAVKKQHDVAVVLDSAGRRMRIHEDRDNDGTIDADEPVRSIPFEEGVLFGMGAAPAMSGASESITFNETISALPVVRFLRNGSASEDGAFYLTSTRWAQGSEYAKDTRALRVDRPTGRVTWYHYDGSSWNESF